MVLAKLADLAELLLVELVADWMCSRPNMWLTEHAAECAGVLGPGLVEHTVDRAWGWWSAELVGFCWSSSEMPKSILSFQECKRRVG